MSRPDKEPAPIPLTESLTIQLTLSGQDLEHFNTYRAAVYALNPDNWPPALKQAFTGARDQRGHYSPLKATAGEALARAICEQVEAELRTRTAG